MLFANKSDGFTSNGINTAADSWHVLISGDDPGTVEIEIEREDQTFVSYPELRFAGNGAHIVTLPDCLFRIKVTDGGDEGTTVEIRK